MATPTTSAAAPATPATTARPKAPARGRMVFQLKKLDQPLGLEQVTRDPKWDAFKTYFGVCIGGFCFMAWVVFLSFQWGRAGQTTLVPTAVQSVATPVALPPVQQNTAPQPQWSSYADCQRHYVLTLRQDPEGACDSFK